MKEGWSAPYLCSARCSNSSDKNGRIGKKAADADAATAPYDAGALSTGFHGPRHRPSGTWLSSGIMPASPVAAPTTRAPEHLEPQVALGLERAHGTSSRSSLQAARAIMKPTKSGTQ